MKSLCVYCGSRDGISPLYKKTAFELGAELAKRQIRLIYGGAQCGLMGAVADGVLSQNGEVIGILPKFLSTKEIAHSGLTEFIEVESMHQRKLMMVERSDAFMALPGGLGTFEELFEVLTWRQLNLIKKPVGLLNIDGFYDHLISLVNSAKAQNFIPENIAEMLLFESDHMRLLDRMQEQSAHF